MELCLNSCSEGKVWSGGNPLCPVVKEEVTIFIGDLADFDHAHFKELLIRIYEVKTLINFTVTMLHNIL